MKERFDQTILLKNLLFLVPTFHDECRHVEMTSRNRNSEKSELLKNFPSRNYELKRHSGGSFVPGSPITPITPLSAGTQMAFWVISESVKKSENGSTCQL